MNGVRQTGMETNKIVTSGFLLLAAVALLQLAGGTRAFAGGRQQVEADTGSRAVIEVFASIQPQAYFLERIGGERVHTDVLVKPGQDPHTFEPTPQQMARLAEARLFFRIGIEFENTLMPRIESTMKQLEVVDCREGIAVRRMQAYGHPESGLAERGGEENGHDEHDRQEEHETGDEREGSDPHVWLSVRNAMRIADTMRDALIRIDPPGRDFYIRSHKELVQELEELDRRIAGILEPVAGKRFFVFHPSFGYFADDYGLEQHAVEIGGSEPSARQLAYLIREAREEGVRVIFVQPQFSRKSAETIAAEIDGAVVPIDPLARDYVENLERMALAVEEGLR